MDMIRFATPRMKSAVLILFVSVLLFFSFVFFTNSRQSKKISNVVSPMHVHDIINDSTRVKNYIVLDLRGRMDYVRGHLVSAMWVSADSIQAKIDLLPKNKTIILYDQTGTESLKAMTLFLRNGFTKLNVLEGGFANWTKNGFPAAIQLVMNTSNRVDIESKTISAEEVFERFKNSNGQFALIDIRSHIAYKDGHIKNSISIPYVPINEFVVNIEEQNFSRDKPLILYCDRETSDILPKAADVLMRNYYTKVYLMNDGIEEWFAKSYPVD
jgi:rhodanese-related sulfurtransferase